MSRIVPGAPHGLDLRARGNAQHLSLPAPIAADRVRVHLTNEFGAGPLELETARLAVVGHGGSERWRVPLSRDVGRALA